MRYKVGDKVRVRKDLVAYKEYICDGKLVRTNGTMAHMKGKILTIKKINEVDKDYMVKENEWHWNDEMFEPVITNWDKVKEEMVLKKGVAMGDIVCQAIRRMKKVENCFGTNCKICYEWLKQPYKEPSILDEAEKKYLSDVIRPFRCKIYGITKHTGTLGEYIIISINDDANVIFPYFKEGTMYKGMELNKEYTLDELEI